MVKDVFYISELFVQFNELDSGCMAMVMVRSHTVCKPKLSYSHDEEHFERVRDWEVGEETTRFLGLLRLSGDPLTTLALLAIFD